MKVYELENIFYALCESKSKELNALHSEYRNNKKQSIYEITLDKLKIELIYHKKKSLFIPISTLYCRIYIDRENDAYFHLPEIISFINNDDFRCCYFPYIENVYRLNACFQQLFDILDDYIFYISMMDNDEKNRLYEFQKNFLIKAFDLDEENYDGNFERNFYDKNYYPHKFTSFDGYIYFLNNDYSKAIKEYEKIEKNDILCPYEIQLVEYMNINKSFDSIPDDCYSRKVIDPYIKGGKTYLKELLLCFFTIFIPLCILCCLSIIIYRNLMTKDCVISFGCEWYFGILASVLPSLFGGITYRKEILSFYKKDEYFDFDDLINGQFINHLSKLVFAVSIAVMLFIMAVCMSDITRFYDDCFDVAGKDLFSHISYEYKEIQDVYYMKARYNEYDERVERSSYVIHMNNDDFVDLDLVLSDEEMKEYILPLIGKKVINVDSELELDWYK